MDSFGIAVHRRSNNQIQLFAEHSCLATAVVVAAVEGGQVVLWDIEAVQRNAAVAVVVVACMLDYKLDIPQGAKVVDHRDSSQRVYSRAGIEEAGEAMARPVSWPCYFEARSSTHQQ